MPSATQAILIAWSQSTLALTAALPPASLFPLVDLWRLALLDPNVSKWASPTSASDPISIFMTKAAEALQDTDRASSLRNFILTVLRLLSNAFASPVLAQKLLLHETKKTMTAVLVPSLLHADGAVRTAAASLAFNVAGIIQKGRIANVRQGSSSEAVVEDEDWELELVSAVVEALDRERASEEVGET